MPSVARRQGGVFTAGQAIAEGWTPRQVRRRVARGRWRPLVGRVLIASSGPSPRMTSAAPSHPITAALARAWAAQLLWPDAISAFRTAAVLWQFPVPDDGVAHVIGARGRRARGARVHAVEVAPGDITSGPRGLRVTTRRRTLLDCLAGLAFDEALDLYAWATSRRLLARDDVIAGLAARAGRPGAGQLRRLLEVTATGAVSGGEYRLHTLMSAARIAGWRAGVRIEDAEGVIGVVDVLFEAAKLVVEVDGERAHSGRAAFVRDRNRQNRLVNAGYRVLRFTWWDLTERPEGVIRAIRRSLAAAA
jgi:very-short-patch-repair endonuclease